MSGIYKSNIYKDVKLFLWTLVVTILLILISTKGFDVYLTICFILIGIIIFYGRERVHRIEFKSNTIEIIKIILFYKVKKIIPIDNLVISTEKKLNSTRLVIHDKIKNSFFFINAGECGWTEQIILDIIAEFNRATSNNNSSNTKPDK